MTSSPIPKPLRHIYDLVADNPNLAADDALVHALEKLDEPLRELAIEKLVTRANRGGLGPLVANFDRYDDHLKGLVLDRIEVLFEATRTTMASESPAARLGAIHLIRASRNYRLSYLLSDVLPRRCPKSTEAAMACFLILARALVQKRKDVADGAERRALRSDAEHFADAVGQALDSWPAHHRTEVLVAAMLHSDLTERVLFKKASQTRLHLSRALNNTLRSEQDPAMAGYALRALGHPDLRGAAVETISTNTDAEFLSELFDAMWITADPEIARACSRIRSLDWLNQGVGSLQSLTPRRATGAVRLISLSGIPMEQKLRVYQSLASDSAANGGSLREASVWQIAAVKGPDATALLVDAAASCDETVSSVATTELFRRDPSQTRAVVRRLAGTTRRQSAQPIDADYDNYCERFHLMEPARRIEVGKRLLQESPDRFHRRLGALFRDADSHAKILALEISRSLGVAEHHRDRIFRLSHDHDQKTRSCAVALLGELDGATALRILRQSLSDPDPRVQANAVEVLGTSDARQWELELTARMNETGNRVQANAIRSMLRIGAREAAVALVSMLTHTSASHRISALWVVEQLQLVALAPRVLAIATEDPDTEVRERAERLLAVAEFSAAASTTPGYLHEGDA